MYWGFCGAAAFGVVAYAFKPDTRYVRLCAERESLFFWLGGFQLGVGGVWAKRKDGECREEMARDDSMTL
jgi:hypothetical protein